MSVPAFARHVPRLARLALPLVLSMSSVTVMQVVDAVFVGRHSEAALAALGPASMATILVQGLFLGTAGFAGALVARRHGAGDGPGERRAAWLGLHVAWVAGLLALALAWPASWIFGHLGHVPEVARLEATYFALCVAGSIFPTVSAALSGWLSGRGETAAATIVHLASFALNAGLAAVWVPASGLTGAAWATLVAQALAALLFLALFSGRGGLAPDVRGLDREALRGFLALALPQGLRVSVELLAWTAFLVFVGRVGVAELAASSLAFRINGTAFFPSMGLAQAAGILVAQARGAGRDAEVPAIAWQALGLCAAWLSAMGVVFLAWPRELMGVFLSDNGGAVTEIGVVLLRFVAFYCLFDAGNVVLAQVLSSLGDTRWVLRVFLVATGTFLVGLVALDRTAPSLAGSWTLATLFVCVTALAWARRFHGGNWRHLRLPASIDGQD